jgi:hypothetical protein
MIVDPKKSSKSNTKHDANCSPDAYLNCNIRFEHLKVSIVIDRLILRRKYWVALAICQYLKIPEPEGANRILAHWACYKVSFSIFSNGTVVSFYRESCTLFGKMFKIS